jgi:hypothetical protein
MPVYLQPCSGTQYACPIGPTQLDTGLQSINQINLRISLTLDSLSCHVRLLAALIRDSICLSHRPSLVGQRPAASVVDPELDPELFASLEGSGSRSKTQKQMGSGGIRIQKNSFNSFGSTTLPAPQLSINQTRKYLLGYSTDCPPVSI